MTNLVNKDNKEKQQGYAGKLLIIRLSPCVDFTLN